MSARIARAKNDQRGLTLIELIVVLVILVGLGGLLVPAISNALTRTHVATCAQNIPEITNTLFRLNTLTGSYGDGWSTGVYGTGATNADQPVNNFLADGTTARTGAVLTSGTLSADQVDALNGLGIVNVFDHAPETSADFNVTFNNGIEPNGATSETLATTTQVIILSDAQAQGVYLQTGGSEQYIWLGLDKSWTGLGTVAPEPPVHFGDNPDGGLPDQTYSRFGAIFQVADAAGDPVAEFKRVTYSLDGDAFETADDHIGIYWDEIDASN
ncbi:MAG: prepilin-type N-terminal cleavage/methylation domain-containing protein [Planctomycetota bacterium]